MEWNLEELFKTENDFYNEIENIKRKLEKIEQFIKKTKNRSNK